MAMDLDDEQSGQRVRVLEIWASALDSHTQVQRKGPPLSYGRNWRGLFEERTVRQVERVARRAGPRPAGFGAAARVVAPPSSLDPNEMEDPHVATTKEDLQEAFAGESQANRKYLAFARQAEKDGFANVAKLFRTAAEAETIHALGHLNALGGVKTTAENLQAAVDGETYEHTEMYPPMLEQAEREGHQAKRMFSFAAQAEAVHAKLYRQALEAVKQGRDLDVTDIYLCPICGHVEFGQAPAACPICGTKAAKFVQV